jgi:hypothetical protein
MICVLCVVFAAPVYAATPKQAETAYAAAYAARSQSRPRMTNAVGVLRVIIDRQVIAAVANPLFVNETPLVPLRAISEHLGANVLWDAAQKQAIVEYAGRHFVSGAIVKGTMMVSPEQVSHIFGIPMQYEPSLLTMTFGPCEGLDNGKLLALLPHYECYTQDDVYWLARIVEAEARGESYESRLAVANVVLNRLTVPQYPDTVKEVIFDKKHGVQFTPTINGAINRKPSQLSTLAALDALEGYNNAPGALFFLSPRLATNFWIQKNRQFAFAIGGHDYYY